MREPLNGYQVKDDLRLAQQGIDLSLKLLDRYGPVPMVKVMLDYYQGIFSELLLTGTAIGL